MIAAKEGKERKGRRGGHCFKGKRVGKRGRGWFNKLRMNEYRAVSTEPWTRWGWEWRWRWLGWCWWWLRRCNGVADNASNWDRASHLGHGSTPKLSVDAAELLNVMLVRLPADADAAHWNTGALFTTIFRSPVTHRTVMLLLLLMQTPNEDGNCRLLSATISSWWLMAAVVDRQWPGLARPCSFATDRALIIHWWLVGEYVCACLSIRAAIKANHNSHSHSA